MDGILIKKPCAARKFVYYFYTVPCTKRMVQNSAMCTPLNFFFLSQTLCHFLLAEKDLTWGHCLQRMICRFQDLHLVHPPSTTRKKKNGKIMHPCHSRQLRSWAEHLQMFTLIKDITEIQLHCKSIISIIATWMLHFTCLYY